MLGRSKERTEEAAQDVIATTGVNPAMVHVMIVDLASLQSVRDFVTAFKQSNHKSFFLFRIVVYDCRVFVQLCRRQNAHWSALSAKFDKLKC